MCNFPLGKLFSQIFKILRTLFFVIFIEILKSTAPLKAILDQAIFPPVACFRLFSEIIDF